MQTAKQEAVEVIRNLPDDSTLEDIQYHLYVLEKIRKDRSDISNGQSCTQEEAKARLSRWLEK